MPARSPTGQGELHAHDSYASTCSSGTKFELTSVLPVRCLLRAMSWELSWSVRGLSNWLGVHSYRQACELKLCPMCLAPLPTCVRCYILIVIVVGDLLLLLNLQVFKNSSFLQVVLLTLSTDIISVICHLLSHCAYLRSAQQLPGGATSVVPFYRQRLCNTQQPH